MQIPSLEYPVFTLDGRLLLSAGTALDEVTLQEVAAAGRRAGGFKPQPLLAHGQIRRDLRSFLNRSPYRELFDDADTQRRIWKKIEDIFTVAPCCQALDYFQSQDFYTYRHILTVLALTALLSEDLNPDDATWRHDSPACPAHDIGKISLPLEVLRKSAPLKRSERHQLEHHSLAGYVLVSYYLGDHRHSAARIARDHHERRNGGGYPRGIRTDDPLVEIIMVCDIYDALISPRPYRPASYGRRCAIEELTRLAKRDQIGWEALKALVAHHRRTEYAPDKIRVSTEFRCLPPANNNYDIIQED